MKIMMKNIRYIFVLTLALLTWSEALGGNTYEYQVNCKVSDSGGGKVYIKKTNSTTPVSNIAESDWVINGYSGNKATYGGDYGILISWYGSAAKGSTLAYARANTGYRFLGFAGQKTIKQAGTAKSDTSGNNHTDLGVGTESSKMSGVYYITLETIENASKQGGTQVCAVPFPCYATFGVPKVGAPSFDKFQETFETSDATINKIVSNSPSQISGKNDIIFKMTDAYEGKDFTVTDKSTAEHPGITFPTGSNALSYSRYLKTVKGSADETNKGTLPITINSTNRHGVQTATIEVKSNYDGTTGEYSTQTFSIILDVDLTPYFSLNKDSYEFGDVNLEVTSSTESAISASKGDASERKDCVDAVYNDITWSAVTSGADAAAFSINPLDPFDVGFTPTEARLYSATLTITATYKAANGDVTYTKTVELSGTGVSSGKPVVVKKDDEPVKTFNFANVVGTTTATYVFDVEDAGSDPTLSWTRDTEFFRAEYSEGKLTVNIQSSEEQDPARAISAELKIDGEDSEGTATSGKVTFSGSILPKITPTLSIDVPCYRDTKDLDLGSLLDTNSDGEITMYLSDDTYFTLDGTTFSVKDGTNAGTTTTLYISQSATDTYKAVENYPYTITVQKRTPVVTLNPGRVVYPGQSYAEFISTNNSEVVYYAEISGIDASQARLLNMRELHIGTFVPEQTSFILHVTQRETENYLELDYYTTIWIVNNPAHVPFTMSQEVFNNRVEKTLGGEPINILNEPFVFSSNDVEWTGNQWVNNAWTGKEWSPRGNTNQFTFMADGASVVFHFAGVPDVLSFNVALRYGTEEDTYLKAQYSADGSQWHDIGTYSAAASVSQTIPHDTRYLKFNRVGTEYFSIQGLNITEGVYLRLAERFIDILQSPDGSYADHEFTFDAANWGDLTIESLSDGFTATLSDNVTESYTQDVTIKKGYDTHVQGTLTVHHEGSATDAGWILIKSNETVLDNVRLNAIPRYIAGVYDDENKSYSYPEFIYTGTDPSVTADASALAEKRRTFEHTFDNEGHPLFDKLYVFGVTRNTDNAVTTTNGVNYPYISVADDYKGSNAKIPCYVYAKDNENNRYAWESTITNMNVASKPFPIFSTNGQKLYFTGTCEHASVGCQDSEEGVIHLRGASGTTADIYIERCSITARYKSESGKRTDGAKSTEEGQPGRFDKHYNSTYAKGSGAVLVFECTDTGAKGFSPSVHIRGNNSIESKCGLPEKTYDLWQWSAPIDMHVTSLSSRINLTMDDLWPITSSDAMHTMGRLDLRHVRVQCMSINMGNDKNELTFNGGYYYFQPTFVAVGSSDYDVNYTIGTQYTLGKYGVGDAVSGGTVYFNDGTFATDRPGSTPKLPIYETHPSQIRSTKKTYVNGGSFLDVLIACDDNNEEGWGTNIYNRYLDEVSDYEIESEGTTENGVAIISLPDELNQYYIDKKDEVGYGQQSIKANSEGVVRTMVPVAELGLESLRGYKNHPWVYAVPQLEGQLNAFVRTQVSSDVTVANGEFDLNQNLLYLEIDDATAEQLENYDPNVEGYVGVKIRQTREQNYSSILNTGDYEIKKNLTMMIPIVADQWYTFTAPFDIETVSVIEARDEQAVFEKMLNEDNEELAYVQQMQALAYVDWLAYLTPNLFTGTLLGYKFTCKPYTFRQLFSNYSPEGKGGIYQLESFTGSNWDANYFLYEPSVDGEHRSDYWNWTADGPVVNWIPAQPETVDVNNDPLNPKMKTFVMRKGRTYAIQFPYCPGCDAAERAKDGNDAYVRDYWDYWTGKYILLEGSGPQTIWGTESTEFKNHSTTAFTTVNQAAFRGNASFAKLTVPNANTYSHNDEEDRYVSDPGYIAKPGQGFLLVNTPQPAQSAARGFHVANPQTPSSSQTSPSGTATGIPTIGLSEYRSLNPTGSSAVKLLIGDQLYILRDNKLYDVHGREVLAQ